MRIVKRLYSQAFSYAYAKGVTNMEGMVLLALIFGALFIGIAIGTGEM